MPYGPIRPSQFKGGDDLYLLVENLRLYLESEEILLASNGGQLLPDGSEDQMTPLFLGRRFAEGGDRERMFISGGAGYTMNKAALKTLVVDGFPKCFPHMKTFSEDVMVATCFRKVRYCCRAGSLVHSCDLSTIDFQCCEDGRFTF